MGKIISFILRDKVALEWMEDTTEDTSRINNKRPLHVKITCINSPEGSKHALNQLIVRNQPLLLIIVSLTILKGIRFKKILMIDTNSMN